MYVWVCYHISNVIRSKEMYYKFYLVLHFHKILTIELKEAKKALQC